MHMHVSDIADWLKVSRCESMVICHISRRTHLGQARKALNELVGPELGEKVHFLMDHRANKQRYEVQTEQAEQRERELAFDAFRANQAFVLQQQQEARIAEAQQREFARRTLEQAVELGVKWDPASRGYRPLAEDDPEYNSWRERQSERKARLPLSPDKQVELARAKTLAVEGARTEALGPRLKLEEEADIRAEKRKAAARAVEDKRRYDQTMEKLGIEIKAQAKRDEDNAQRQIDLAELRHAQAKTIVNMKAKLAEPVRLAKAEAAKQAAEMKRRERVYFKAQGRYMQAAEDVRQAVRQRNDAEKRLWPQFRKKFTEPGWLISRYPKAEDIEPGGRLAQEWQALIQPINDVVARSQRVLGMTQADLRRAREAYIGGTDVAPITETQAAELIEAARKQLPEGASNAQIKEKARQLAAQQGLNPRL